MTELVAAIIDEAMSRGRADGDSNVQAKTQEERADVDVGHPAAGALARAGIEGR